MLDLNSSRWRMLQSSVGGDSDYAADLLRKAYDDDVLDDELHHQLCHQHSVGEVAFAAMPHLVEIARLATNTEKRMESLALVGNIVASRAAYKQDCPLIPDDLSHDYEIALDDARRLTADILGQSVLSAEESHFLLATLAALHGRHEIALLMMDTLPDQISCPMCGDLIEF